MEKETSNTENPDVSVELILEKVKKMEGELVEISKKRTQRMIFSIIGIIVLTVIIVTFVLNLWDFAKNYDKQSLLKNLQKHAENLKDEESTKKLLSNIQKEVIPLLREEITKEFKKRTEEIHEKAAESAKNIHEYLKKDIHAKLVEEVATSMKKVEKDMLDRYPKIPPERIHKILEEVKVEFIDKLTSSLEDKIETALQDVTILNRSLEKIKEDPEYKQLKKEKIGEVENSLIESMLELTIYNINPQKGRMPALDTEGGAK